MIPEPSTAPDAPEPDLIAAAVAASTWVRERRSAWAADGPPLPPLHVALPRTGGEPEGENHFDALAWQEQTRRRATPPAAPAPEPPPAVPVSEPATAPVREKSAATAALLSNLARRSVSFGARAVKPVAAAVGIALLGLALRGVWQYVTVTLRTGAAVIDSVPEPSGVSIDGIVVGQTPISRRLSVGHHTIEFRTRKATRVVTLDVTARGENVARVDWAAKPMGHLHVESSPTGAQVMVDGNDRGVTPLTLDLPVGPHAVVLRNTGGSVQRNVTIANDKTSNLSEGLYAGFLHVTSPIELTISEGSRSYPLSGRQQALLPAGAHVLQLRNAALGYSATRRVEIIPGEVTNIDVAPGSTLTVTSTLQGRVFVDGVDVGETPLTDHPVHLGTRDIVVKAITGIERHASVNVTAAPAHLDVDFSTTP